MLVVTVFIRGRYSVFIGFIGSYLSIFLIRAFTVVSRGKMGVVEIFFLRVTITHRPLHAYEI